jgi:PHP family Zn ribbon phosphoesterase
MIYNKLIAAFGNEFAVLLDAPSEALKKVVDEKLVQVILKNRVTSLSLEPGYDGVYGKILLGKDEVVKEKRTQKSLNEF